MPKRNEQRSQSTVSSDVNPSVSHGDKSSGWNIPRKVDVTFREENGIKYLESPSNHTATLVQVGYPLLCMEARHAMEFVQQTREMKIEFNAKDFFRSYPLISKWGNRKELLALLDSLPGSPDPNKWATQAMAGRLQLSEATVRRYARGYFSDLE